MIHKGREAGARTGNAADRPPRCLWRRAAQMLCYSSCYRPPPGAGRQAKPLFPLPRSPLARLLSALLSNKWKRRLSVIDSFDNPHVSLPAWEKHQIQFLSKKLNMEDAIVLQLIVRTGFSAHTTPHVLCAMCFAMLAFS